MTPLTPPTHPSPIRASMPPSSTMSSRSRFALLSKDNINQLRLLHISTLPVRYNERFYENLVHQAEQAPDNPVRTLSGRQLQPAGPIAHSNPHQTASPNPHQNQNQNPQTQEDKWMAAYLTRMIMISDNVVGAVACRVEDANGNSNSNGTPETDTNAEAEAEAETNANTNTNTKSGTHPNIDAGAKTHAREHEKRKKIYILTLSVLEQYRKRGLGTKMLKRVLEFAETHAQIVKVYLHVQANNEEALKFYAKFGFQQGATVENYYKKIVPSTAIVLEKYFQKNE